MSRLGGFATQHAMPPEFGRKWETECLNNRFPLPTLLYAGYSVKLIFINSVIYFSFSKINKQIPNTIFISKYILNVNLIECYQRASLGVFVRNMCLLTVIVLRRYLNQMKQINELLIY